MIALTLFHSICIASFLMRSVTFLPVRNFSTQTAEQNCDRIVASAAPRTPIWNTKIKIGSRTIFKAAPIRIVSIPIFPKPWQLINGFSPSEIITNGVPIR